MLTCCITVSVVATPQPFIHASNVPVCGGSEAELLMIFSGLWVDVRTHGAGLAAPFSNPGLPNIWTVPPPPPAATIVSAIVVVCVIVPPVAVIVTVAVPVVAVVVAANVSVELPLPGAAIDVGAKVAVTPAGRPDAES